MEKKVKIENVEEIETVIANLEAERDTKDTSEWTENARREYGEEMEKVLLLLQKRKENGDVFVDNDPDFWAGKNPGSWKIITYDEDEVESEAGGQ